MGNRRGWKTGLALACIAASAAAGGMTLRAENWSAGFGIGLPQEAGATKDALDAGFGFNVNFAYKNPDNLLGLRMDVIYAVFDLSDQVLRHIDGADGGYFSTWGFGTSLLIEPKGEGKLKPFLYGGPGIYYVAAEATRIGVGTGIVCDPWYGCYEVLAPGEYGVARQTTSRLGWQGGAGLGLHFEDGGSLTLEFQYVNINTTNVNTEFCPINLGFNFPF